MRFAYADPPYIGMARRHYSNDSKCAEVNHRILIETLMMEFPDGWALSCLPRSLKELLGYCPDRIRIMPWVKPFVSFIPGINPRYAWESVIVYGGRRRKKADIERYVPDYVIASAPSITAHRQAKFVGCKPAEFCYWLFEVLNMNPDDEFVDIFPGSGAVTRCWELWRSVHSRREGMQLRLMA